MNDLIDKDIPSVETNKDKWWFKSEKNNQSR